VIWVYDAAGNVVETHEHNGILKSASSDLKNTPNVSVCVFCSAVVRESFKSANLSDAGTGRGENSTRRMHVFTGHTNVKTMFVFVACWSSTQRV